jgi:hypothetical protein
MAQGAALLVEGVTILEGPEWEEGWLGRNVMDPLEDPSGEGWNDAHGGKCSW